VPVRAALREFTGPELIGCCLSFQRLSAAKRVAVRGIASRLAGDLDAIIWIAGPRIRTASPRHSKGIRHTDQALVPQVVADPGKVGLRFTLLRRSSATPSMIPTSATLNTPVLKCPIPMFKKSKTRPS